MAGSKHLSVDTKTGEVTDPLVLNLINVLLTLGGFTIDSSGGVKTIGLGATSGVKVGATGDKVGFLGATPVVRPTGNLFTALSALGLVGSPSLTVANITSLQSLLDLLAPLASPALTGNPTAPTQTAGNASTRIATTLFVATAIANLVNAAPGALDTLKELADAMGDDPNFAATVANSIATKLAKASNLSDLTDAAAARGNLGIGSVNNTSDADKPVSTAQAAAIVSAISNLLAAGNTFTGQNIFTLLQTFNAIAASSVSASQLANAGAPTVTPIGDDEGATWSYKIVAKLSDGTPSAAGPAGTTTHGDQTLDATNKNSLSWTAVPGAASYDVYRTAHGTSPSTNGKIANVPTNAYVDTGAAGDGSTPPSTNSTGRVSGAIWDKGGQFYNIMAYGGAPGGVIDNYAAFEATKDAVRAAGGGTITAPAGTFALIAGGLTLEDGMHLQCAGAGRTILKRGPGMTQALVNLAGQNQVLRNVTLDGNGSVSTTLIPELSLGDGALVENCEIKNIRHIGIAVFASATIRNNRITGMNSASIPCTGIWMDLTTNGLLIEGNTIKDHGVNAIYVSGKNIRVLGNHIENNHMQSVPTGGGQIDIQGDSVTPVSNILIKGNIITWGRGTTNGIEISSPGDISIIGNYISYNTSSAIIAQAAGQKLHIANNTVKNNASGIDVTANCSHFEIVNNRCFDDQVTPTQAYGISVSPGPKDYYIISGNLCYGNVTQDIWDQGTGIHKQVFANIPGPRVPVSVTVDLGVLGGIYPTIQVPPGFSSFVLRINSRETGVDVLTDIRLRFNADTGAHYEYQTISAYAGANPVTSAYTGQTSIRLGATPGTTADANYPSAHEVTVPDYGNTSLYKAVLVSTRYRGNSGAIGTELVAGSWNVVDPITSVTILNGTGNVFAVGATAELIME